MAKIRVYELARELKIESKALLVKMQEIGITVPSHQSTLTVAQIDKIRASLDAAAKTTVVVRRRKKAPGEEFEHAPDEASEAAPVATAASLPTSSSVTAASLSGAPVIRRRERGIAQIDQSGAGSSLSSKGTVSTQAESPNVAESPVGGALTGKDIRHAPITAAPQDDAVSAHHRDPSRAASITSKVVADAEAKARKQIAAQKMADLAEQATGVDASKNEAMSSPVAKFTPQEGARKNLAQKIITSGPGRSSSEVQSAPSDEPVSGSEMKEVPLHDEGKRSFSGATIVRRATVEERNALRAKEEARQRTSRREDSRGVRVTGIGVRTRMEDSEGPAAKFPVATETDVDESKKHRGIGKKFSGKHREDDERPAPSKSALVQQNKWRMSTRDILSVVDTGIEFEAESFNTKKRVVYTPNQQQRRRDLKKRKDLNQTAVTQPRAAYRVVKLESPTIVVSELAKQLSVKSAEIIKKLMDLNVMATINQTIDFDTASLISHEFGYECKLIGKTEETLLHDEEAGQFEIRHRPPIVTVMGHVDHGKTSILDAIRQTSVTASESGGITQHIGAYTVEHLGQTITFLDTPGHEAFSAMRARGSQVTDIVVLVVAGDDGVMPQTKEAISHAKNAAVPIIVAINKIDKPNLNLDRVFTELSELGVQAEEWGGDTQFVQVSALKKIGLDKLLEAIKVQAEVLELKARYEGRAQGVVLEAHLDKGVGPVATLMAMHGCITVGDYLVAGQVFGKVRMMNDHLGKKLEVAHPAIPVQIIGLQAVPMAGDDVHVVTNEKVARDLIKLRKEHSLGDAKSAMATSLEELFSTVANAEVPQVPVIVKADTQGSVEAIVSSLEKLRNKQVKTRIIHSAVGGINESDINLAATSNAILIGFNVRATSALASQAESRGVLIRYFSIIYDVVDTVKALMAGKLPPICTEVIQGHAEVRNLISVPKVGVVAGSAVLDGKITRSSQARLIRDKVVIYRGKISSLRRFKDDVKEVQHGFECGICIDGYSDVRVGDVIEAFIIEETAAKLELEP